MLIPDLILDYEPDAFVPVSRYIPRAQLENPHLLGAKACQHAQVDFGKPANGMVEVVCLACAHRWVQVKILEPRRAAPGEPAR